MLNIENVTWRNIVTAQICDMAHLVNCFNDISDNYSKAKDYC